MLLLGLLVLLGASLTSAVFSGGGGGAGESAQDVEMMEFGDEDQIIADEDSRGTVVSLIDFLEASGTLTALEADEALSDTIFVDGPVHVSTGGGADTVLAGAAQDYVDTGTGDDTAFGGAGDDTLQLGDGDDLSGLTNDDWDDDGATAQALEGGDDFIRGGRGDDVIADAYGQNRLAGNQGADTIVAVDADGVTPDHVLGGFGNDLLIVDEGDTVETGQGNDRVTVDLEAGFGEGYQVVTITDFDVTRDVLELEEGEVGVVELVDGSGTEVTLDGVPIARLVGVLGLSEDDLALVV